MTSDAGTAEPGERVGDFTVITYFTPDFAGFLEGLSEDCQRLCYPLHAHACPQSFENLIAAFDYKIEFIRKAIEQFGRVLWLDVECRIDRPIPSDWNSPLISCYESGTSAGFSSGVLMLDPDQLPLVELWSRYAQKYPRFPDDFVLDFLATRVEMPFHTVPFEFYDRQTTCSIARGEWLNEHTIIRHPTTNRWLQPLRYREAFNGRRREKRAASEMLERARKTIFYRNFAGDFDVVDREMTAGQHSEFRYAEWVFDTQLRYYAPERFWPDAKADFTTRPHGFQASWEQFQDPPARKSFRQQAISQMRLSRDDARDLGVENPSLIHDWWSRMSR